LPNSALLFCHKQQTPLVSPLQKAGTSLKKPLLLFARCKPYKAYSRKLPFKNLKFYFLFFKHLNLLNYILASYQNGARLQ